MGWHEIIQCTSDGDLHETQRRIEEEYSELEDRMFVWLGSPICEFNSNIVDITMGVFCKKEKGNFREPDKYYNFSTMEIGEIDVAQAPDEEIKEMSQSQLGEIVENTLEHMK